VVKKFILLWDAGDKGKPTFSDAEALSLVRRTPPLETVWVA